MARDGSSTTDPRAAEDLQLDHVLVGVGDLEAGCGEVEGLTGVRPGAGGVHPQWGTHNALQALGPGCYLELIALCSRAPASGPFGFLRALEQVRPVGWSVATSDTARTRQRLQAAGFALTPVSPGARERPDGSRLSWKTFGFADRPLVGVLPFFIEWESVGVHPAASSPRGCSLRRLTIKDADIEPLAKLGDLLALEVELVAQEQPGLELILETPEGSVSLGG